MVRSWVGTVYVGTVSSEMSEIGFVWVLYCFAFGVVQRPIQRSSTRQPGGQVFVSVTVLAQVTSLQAMLAVARVVITHWPTSDIVE